MNIVKKILKRLRYYSIKFTNWKINFELRHCSSLAIKSLKRKNVIKGGHSTIIRKGVYVESYQNVRIGDGCVINTNVKFYVEGKGEPSIIIGNNVNIARDVIFGTGSHILGDSNRRAGESCSKNIQVGDGTWIGMGAIILQGVVVGEGCIIQAGSVVFKNCKPNCIYGGNPAKLITDLSKIKALG